MANAQTYRMTRDELDALFQKLEERFVLYAPVHLPAGGRYSGQDSVVYRPVHSYGEIEYRERSTWPMGEVLTPITQTLFHFIGDKFHESEAPKKDLLIFGRACDINAVAIQDQIYLHNGKEPDYFYQRVRERCRFVLMECTTQFDGCFCCSVGSNETDAHSLAISFGQDEAQIEVRDEELASCFGHAAPSDYRIRFPQENELKLVFPHIDSLDLANALKEHPMWAEFDDRCIGCGSCTVSCPTCTCFETTDLVYTQNAHIGERRRTCSSCMVDGFDRIAGGECFREKISERYRYRIMHKVYGHDARFHSGPMCVGCGRCTARCPELISYPATLDKLSAAIRELKAKDAVQHE